MIVVDLERKNVLRKHGDQVSGCRQHLGMKWRKIHPILYLLPNTLSNLLLWSGIRYCSCYRLTKYSLSID
jgi:hypothetical protein